MSQDSNVDGDTITTGVDSAQPGRWRVRFDFVSATDGHRYGSSYSFTVKGERDCAQEDDGEKGEEEEGEMGSGDRSDDDMASSSQSGGHSEGQSVPVGALVAASAIAFATGLIARIRPRLR